MVLFFFQFELKMALHAALTKKKICEVNDFRCFFRRVNYILMFFQEELAPLLSMGKPFSSDPEVKKSKFSPRHEPVTILTLAN